MKKHVPYAWGPEHNQAFDNIKREIVQAPILKYYDLKKQSSKLMHPSKDLELVYSRMGTPSTLQVNHCKTQNVDMLPWS